MQSFDEKLLEARLNMVSPAMRVIFALGCSERWLQPIEHCQANHHACFQYSIIFREAVDKIWGAMVNVNSTEVEKLSNIVLNATPKENEKPVDREFESLWFELLPYAQNAGIIINSLVECAITEGAQQAVLVAQNVYYAIDSHVQEIESELDLNLPGAELSLIMHPLIQNEFARQIRDLDEIENVAMPTSEILAKFRSRCKDEYAIELGF